MIAIIQKTLELARYLRLHLLPLRIMVEQADQKLVTRPHNTVVVSLTTIPDRVHKILPTIASILTQTIRPDAIYLNIPYFSRRQAQSYQIPEYLQTCDAVQILRTKQDWGPATKLLPLLGHELPPDTQIIVIDDDQIYPQRLIENYLHYSRQKPHSALCLAGWQIPEDCCHGLRIPIEGAKTRLLDRPATVLDRPKPVEIIQGATSYLVRPRFFTSAVFDYDRAPLAAFFADDIWISGHLAQNKVPRLVIPGDFHYARVQSLTSFRSLSLCQSENKDGKNNQQLYELFHQYWRRYDVMSKRM